MPGSFICLKVERAGERLRVEEETKKERNWVFTFLGCSASWPVLLFPPAARVCVSLCAVTGNYGSLG